MNFYLSLFQFSRVIGLVVLGDEGIFVILFLLDLFYYNLSSQRVKSSLFLVGVELEVLFLVDLEYWHATEYICYKTSKS